MSIERFYYSDTISRFLRRSSTDILGKISSSSTYKDEKKTKNSWLEEIAVLKKSLKPYSAEGSVFFEYSIPRMGKRVDVIVIIKNIIFVLEFKTSSQKFNSCAINQVWDYALDLKNFQEGSQDRFIIPILIAPSEKDKDCQLDLDCYEDKVFRPLCCNTKLLTTCFSKVLNEVPHNPPFSAKCDMDWATSGYSPTPTIIEAATALYEEHSVEEITKHGGDVAATGKCIQDIVNQSRKKRKKAICFVTGVPGAGKTLIGLETAIDQFKKKEKAVYLSGNYPLVKVLQEALARDTISHQKQAYQSGLSKKKPDKKEKVLSKVQAFIQLIHVYRDLYLENVKITKDKIVQDSKKSTKKKDSSYIPVDHVAIFDEAQRAWTKEELARFMKEKKKIKAFPFSEPEYMISCMDRRTDWGVIICLIGGGQEINKGEAGMLEWVNAINRRYRHWDVYISDKINEQEYVSKNVVELFKETKNVKVEPALHLDNSMRSFRAEKVSLFVHQLLDLKPVDAVETLKSLERYPIYITRSLDDAKNWLREHARGSERMGLLASSKAERLKAISVNVRYQPNFVHWFLGDKSDIRSSNSLEDVLTEFKVQGLEIDWAGVIWDADLRLDKGKKKWQHYQLRSGTKWQNINKTVNQEYQINAYRVLLTRARQGMVIVVPEGDDNDDTRKKEWYNGIYDYLKECGIQEFKR